MPESRELSVTFVLGVTPGKWIYRWEERMPHVQLATTPVPETTQLDAVRDGSANMAFVRLPVDKDGLHVIPLYEELLVVVAPKDHPIAAFEEIAVEDLADEYLLADPDEFPAWRDISSEIKAGTRKPLPEMASTEAALDLVEAGLGILILPMSVARHFNRKELRARKLTGAGESAVGLAWLRKELPEDEEAVIQEFIGVVRGRKESSSRQPSVQAKQMAESKKTALKNAAEAKKAANIAARAGGKSGGNGRSAKAGTGNSRGPRPGGKARAQKRGKR